MERPLAHTQCGAAELAPAVARVVPVCNELLISRLGLLEQHCIGQGAGKAGCRHIATELALLAKKLADRLLAKILLLTQQGCGRQGYSDYVWRCWFAELG